MWTEEHDMVASDFLLNKNITKLVVYMDRDIGMLCCAGCVVSCG